MVSFKLFLCCCCYDMWGGYVSRKYLEHRRKNWNCFLLTFDKINFNMLIKPVINMWRLYRYINSKIIYSQIVGNNSNHIFFRKQFDKRWRQTTFHNDRNINDDRWYNFLSVLFSATPILRDLAAAKSLCVCLCKISLRNVINISGCVT